MIFLIEYDRGRGHLVTIQTFVNGDRHEAEEQRLQLELNLKSRGVENEVVLLEASNEKAVRRTHRRYFEDLVELTNIPS